MQKIYLISNMAKQFFGNKTVDQHFGANPQKRVLCKILLQISWFFFSFLPLKTLKMTISTSIWSAQHPNAGRNIQQMMTTKTILSWISLRSNTNAMLWSLWSICTQILEIWALAGTATTRVQQTLVREPSRAFVATSTQNHQIILI